MGIGWVILWALCGIPALFEAGAGALVISGGRRTQFGYVAVMA